MKTRKLQGDEQECSKCQAVSPIHRSGECRSCRTRECPMCKRTYSGRIMNQTHCFPCKERLAVKSAGRAGAMAEA